MSKKSLNTTNQNILFIDSSKKNKQNNASENSNIQISTGSQNFKMCNVENNDIGIGENIYSRKASSELSGKEEDDSFNIHKFNNSIPNYMGNKSNIIYL